MIFKAEKQAITPDWVEMHFRLADAALFCSKEQLEHRKLMEERKHEKPVKSDGKALPKFHGQGKEFLKIGETSFKRKSRGGMFYNDLYHIYHRNKKYGVLLVNSGDAKCIPLDDMQIKIENNKLYETSWLDDLQQMTTQLDAKWHNFTRIDIAVDNGNFTDIYEAWHTKKIMKAGRAGIQVFQKNDGTVTGFYIGAGKSKKRMKIYNKTAELTKSNKHYIEHFWKLNGIDTTQTVNRLELTIRNEESKKYKDIDWTQLNKASHLASIMKSNMEKFCDFRLNNGQENITRMQKVELVNWDRFEGKALPKDSTRPSTETFSAKVTIKKLYEAHLATQAQLYYDVAFEFAMNADLIEWFNKMQSLWRQDLEAKLGDNRDGLVSDSFITRFKSYDVNEQINIFEHAKVTPSDLPTGNN